MVSFGFIVPFTFENVFSMVVNQTNLFSIWFVCIPKTFTTCGLQLWSSKAWHQKLSHFIFVVHILFGILFTYYLLDIKSWYILYLSLKNVPISRKFEMLNEVSQFACAIISYWIITIESYAQRKNQQRFWQILQSIDLHFAQHNRINFRSFLIKFYGYFLCYFLIIAHFFEETISDGAIASLWTFCQIRIFHYLFYVELIKLELEIVNHESKQMFETFKGRFSWDINAQNMKIKLFVRRRFIWLREYCQLVQELINNSNSIFGCSNLSTILYIFNLLLTNLMWMYTNSHLKDVDFIGRTFRISIVRMFKTAV